MRRVLGSCMQSSPPVIILGENVVIHVSHVYRPYAARSSPLVTYARKDRALFPHVSSPMDNRLAGGVTP